MTTEPSAERTFSELIEANRSQILRICRVYGWTPQDAEDLYQEILFQIWRSLPKFNEQSHVNTWLYRVAINTGISFVRKTKASRNPIVIEQSQLIECADQRPIPSRQDDSQLENLYEAMTKLNKVEKAAITLFLEDLSYEEIAEVLGTNTNQVGVLLHRTKKKLFDLMKKVKP